MCVSMQDLKETILKFMKLILFLKFSISWEKDRAWQMLVNRLGLGNTIFNKCEYINIFKCGIQLSMDVWVISHHPKTIYMNLSVFSIPPESITLSTTWDLLKESKIKYFATFILYFYSGICTSFFSKLYVLINS